jgi:signal transduction histidine kinase
MNRNLKFLLLAFALIFFILRAQAQTKDSTEIASSANPGYIDLRNTTFDHQSIPLSGKWKFYWQSLRKPGQTPAYHEFISFPQLWKDSRWHGKPLTSQGFASYEVTVLLPRNSEQLALKIPDTYCAYYLFVNNKLIAKNGKPGTTKQTTTPYWSNQVKPIYVQSDTLKLLLQVANFHHLKGGPVKNIEIGLLGNLQARSDVDHAFDYFLTGCIFMGGFFFLGLYLFGRHDKSILYFSLFCLSYSYRILGSRQYTLHSLFPDLSWGLTIHLEYISLFLAVALFALYTRHLYPEDAPQKMLSAIAGICLAFVLITLISPSILFTRLIDPFIVIVVFSIGFAAVIYWKAFRNKRVGALYALLSSAAIFIIIISIILEYYGIATPFDIILFLGYLIFFFCQSLILTFRFAFTLKKAKEEAELGLKVKGEFLSTMSHEIRTPLNSVIGMTHFMIKESPRPDQKDHLEALLFSANNLLAIVNDVLDFSAIEEGKIVFNNGPLQIASVAKNILAGYKAGANSNKIDFILDIDPDIPEQISGDITRISQIIGNLVNNAVKFTHQGHVTLSVKQQARNASEVTLKIAVEDTGIGIPLEKQQMIFERFTQADSSASRVFSGTGLGLAICKRILELQGIELHLESEPGKGSIFFFIEGAF